MALRLVIAEKPSVAQTIAAALGVKEKKDGYIEGGGCLISWCVGHLVQLAEAAAYGEQYKKWSFESLPILPEEWQYAVDPDKGKQFKTLKELMHRADVSEVVNACDAGREGELIFRFVYEAAGCKKPMRRLWISSMEDGAIKAGFASLKDGRDYGALFASALCRAKADWLIGINATRLFSCLYGKTLNVGRVQTPTLKMLTDRDAAISHFQKEKYYHVRLDLSGADAASERISDKAEADALKGACEAETAVCVSLTREKKTAAPPKLFDLTSLQRETNRIFGYTAKQTLDLAQSLYEKRLLTYPRTDSSYLTDDMGDTAAGIIKLLCGKFSFMAGKDFTPELGDVYKRQTLHKCGGVCLAFGNLRQIVFPFCGKLWGSEYIRQNTDKAVPVFGRDKLLPLALRKAALYQFFNDGGAGGGSAKPPAFRVRVGVPVPGAFHSRQKACFAVGLRRRCGMLRYFCGGVRKALSLGKLRQRHVCIFPVLRFGLIFQRRPVSALKLFPTLRKYGLSPCGEVCPGA